MKKIISLLSLFALSMTLFVSCDDNDDNNEDQPNNATFSKELSLKYPAATNVDWDTKGAYEIASFNLDGKETTVWYSSIALNGDSWQMTVTEMEPLGTSLPLAIKTPFEATIYSKAPWAVDEIDMIERNGLITVYVIDVESPGQADIEIMYTVDGTHVKTQTEIDNDNNSHLPSAIPTAVTEYIQKTYPDAKITDVDSENGMLEVDIVVNGVEKDLLFSILSEWISTTSEVRAAQVKKDAPKVFITFGMIYNAEYLGYIPEMAEIDFVETPTVKYYGFELKQPGTGVEAYLKIDAEGNRLK